MYVNDLLHVPATLFEKEESPIFVGQESVCTPRPVYT
jgi:hypothetical protein